jgi:hypothetical protein
LLILEWRNLRLIGETILDRELVDVLGVMPDNERNRASGVTAGKRAVLNSACPHNDDNAGNRVLVAIVCVIQPTIAEMAMVHLRRRR